MLRKREPLIALLPMAPPPQLRRIREIITRNPKRRIPRLPIQ
jgi:hypothetical protein